MIITPFVEDIENEKLDREELKKFLEKYEKEIKKEDWKSIVKSIDSSGNPKHTFELLVAIFEEILGEDILSKIDYIPSDLFRGNDDVKMIIIPEHITSISDSAFRDCKNLEKVIMNDNIKTIGENLFSGCSKLAEVKLSETLENIPNKAFSGCTALKYLYIPDSVKRLGYDVFYNCPDDMVVEMNRGVNRAEGPDDPHPNALKMKSSTHDFVAKHLKWKNA